MSDELYMDYLELMYGDEECEIPADGIIHMSHTVLEDTAGNTHDVDVIFSTEKLTMKVYVDGEVIESYTYESVTDFARYIFYMTHEDFIAPAVKYCRAKYDN